MLTSAPAIPSGDFRLGSPEFIARIHSDAAHAGGPSWRHILAARLFVFTSPTWPTLHSLVLIWEESQFNRQQA